MSIKLSNIYHTYSKGTPFERLALNDVSLEISKGEIVAMKPEKEGQILTLSTCSGKKKGDDYRLVVNAVIK